MKKSSFFQEISSEKTHKNSKIIEKLFPFSKFEASKPKSSKNSKKDSIEAFLPKPSPYIQEFLKTKSPKFFTKEEENQKNGEISEICEISKKHVFSNFTANSAEKDDISLNFEGKMSRILGNEIGNLIGFFNYEEEKKAFEEIIDLLVSQGFYSKAIELFEEKISKIHYK